MYELSPYFRSLAEQKRLCPECGTRFLRVEPSDYDDPDFAWDVCDCGYLALREAPGWAKLRTGARLPVPDNPIQQLADELNADLRAKRQRADCKVLQFKPCG